jgi:hypothetical protein
MRGRERGVMEGESLTLQIKINIIGNTHKYGRELKFMEEETVPRTERAKAAVARARNIVNSNSEMVNNLLVDLPEHKGSGEVYSIPLEDYDFSFKGAELITHQMIRTTNKFVTFFRDMLSQ